MARLASSASAPAETRPSGALSEQRPARGTWIRIAGPISAVLLGVLGASFYLRPIAVIRFAQETRLGWSGVTRTQIALDDLLVSYYITGGYPDEEPVVLIHGLGPNAALQWRGVMAPLSQAHYKVVAPDLPGFAFSAHKQVPYSIASEAAALSDLVAKLKLDKINLVGHDLGTDVALYYAVDHPDTVERLVLVSGGMIGPSQAGVLRQSELPSSAERMRALADDAFFNLPPMPNFMYERMMAALAEDLPAETGMLDSVAKDEAHIRSKLGQIFNTLTVIMWGGKDRLFSPARAEALHAMLPGSATVVFKTSAHDPPLEHPQEFADSLLYLFRQSEGGR